MAVMRAISGGTLKPRRYLPLGNPEEKLARNELWAESQEAHINCRIYSSLVVRLSPQIYPLGPGREKISK